MKISDLKQLIALQEEYIALLCEELNDTAQQAAIRGWKSKRVEQGERLREKINNQKRKLR